MEEGLQVIKALWGDEPVIPHRAYYTLAGLEGTPKPVQRPHPPILIGGGGKRMLRFAAREADIVGLVPKARPGGGLDWLGSNAATLEAQVGWVRDAAGERFDQLELDIIGHAVVVTDDRPTAAEAVVRHHAYGADAEGLTVEQVLASPDYLLGTVEQITEQLVTQREHYGISRVTVYQNALEEFAPVVAQLAGV